MAALFIARYAFTLLGRPLVHPVLALLVGLVVLTLLGLIPVLGGVLDLVAIVFGLGAMALTLPRFRSSGGTAGTASARWVPRRQAP